jgi:alkylation response protein AidB-like acyl-CoA dehydrogenase
VRHGVGVIGSDRCLTRVTNCFLAWITNAKEAGIFIVFANADPSKGYKVRCLTRVTRSINEHLPF